MPKLRNYQPVTGIYPDRPLTEREVRTLRKFTGIAGYRLIGEVAKNPNHKWRDFVLQLWMASQKSIDSDREETSR